MMFYQNTSQTNVRMFSPLMRMFSQVNDADVLKCLHLSLSDSSLYFVNFQILILLLLIL